MKNKDYLHLLIVEKSENDAESLAMILRNAGHSVQVDYAADSKTFKAALLAQSPDIVLCGSGTAAFDTKAIQDILAQNKLSPPVIALVEKSTESAVVAALRSGITAMVSYDQPEHLQLVVAREITRLQTRQKTVTLDVALSDCEKRCNSLIERSSDAIACIHEGMHSFVNQAYMNLFGVSSPEKINGTPILDLISDGERDSFKVFMRNFQDGTNRENSLRVSCRNQDLAEFDSTMELAPATINGEPCVQILIRSCTSSAAPHDVQIEAMAGRDTLTGLFTRQHFMNLLEKSIDSRNDGDDIRALIYITLDGFKEMREEKGIATSDMALCSIARLLEQKSGKKDSIARFGDYSYAILSLASSSEKIQAMGEKLLHDISNHTSEINGQAIKMSCSIGICAITEHAENGQVILSHADTACEVARSSGGNQIHTHSTVIDGQISAGQEKEWDAVIRKTIDEKRFYLVYQPIISLTGDTSKRYEALLRIVDEEGNTILPGQFLELAEKCGFSTEVDYWVFDTAFRMIAECRDNGDDITIFMKLSRSALADTGLPEWIQRKLEEYRLAHGSVVFELQELDAANDLKGAITFVKAMKKLQCRVAMEHFGINNQPLLLKHVPADILKIDGSLTENLATNREQQARVTALVKLTHSLGATCIAERIDNPGNLAVLWQNGVDMIQGNFIQEPSRELDYDFKGEIA